MTYSPTLALAMELIDRPSVTPRDAGCLDVLQQRLVAMGFLCERLPCGAVDNLIATRGDKKPYILFAGHTDVVPPGPEDQWKFPPFQSTIESDRLYGRGAADMKGSLAAMLVACDDFLRKTPEYQGSIGFLLTSDEEGAAIHGTRHVVEQLKLRNQLPHYCIVGEPSCQQRLGDTLKVGRRGSLNGILRIHGTQGHVAYPQRANNPVHKALPALQVLTDTVWDNGNAFFPATSLQISNIHAGTGANNVIPGTLELMFNFRFNTEQSPEQLKEATKSILDQHHLNYSLDWQLSGTPFLTQDSPLLHKSIQAIEELTGIKPECSTSGGTSDGRFLAPLGVQVLEFGPINATIHQINEWVSIKDLNLLTKIYTRILQLMLLPDPLLPQI